jgi:O-antigen/teichoic acid export membrane protein
MIFALQFIPMAFMAALYPAMASYWGKKDLIKLKQLLSKAFNYLLIMSLPVIAVILTSSNSIVLLFKEEYLAAVPALKVSIIALVFLFLNFPIGSLLNACDLQKKNTGNMLRVAIFSILLNLLLIPKFGALGAAYTALFSNALLFVLGARLIKKIIPYRFKDNFWQSFKTILAAAITGLFIIILLPVINIWFLLLLAAIVYFLAILILRVLSKEDFMYVFTAFKK